MKGSQEVALCSIRPLVHLPHYCPHWLAVYTDCPFQPCLQLPRIEPGQMSYPVSVPEKMQYPLCPPCPKRAWQPVWSPWSRTVSHQALALKKRVLFRGSQYRVVPQNMTFWTPWEHVPPKSVSLGLCDLALYRSMDGNMYVPIWGFGWRVCHVFCLGQG